MYARKRVSRGHTTKRVRMNRNGDDVKQPVVKLVRLEEQSDLGHKLFLGNSEDIKQPVVKLARLEDTSSAAHIAEISASNINKSESHSQSHDENNFEELVEQGGAVDTSSAVHIAEISASNINKSESQSQSYDENNFEELVEQGGAVDTSSAAHIAEISASNINKSESQSQSYDENNFEELFEQGGAERAIDSSSSKRKKHFCIYCKSAFINLPRHLEAVHSNIPDVRSFMFLPKLSFERKKIIEKIRKSGDFQYNTNPNYNKGDLIVCRRPSEKKRKFADDYVACPNCKGYFSKKTMYQHHSNCDDNARKGVRNVLVKGKLITVRYHSVALEALKQRILPCLRDDIVGKLIRYDFLIILFGNRLCEKYKYDHLNLYIRQVLRILGRLLYEVKSINNSVKDFATIYHPKMYNLIIKSVYNVAGLNKNQTEFMKPTLAFNLGTYIKKCGRLLITQYVIDEKPDKMKEVENFLKIFEDCYSTAVNKTAIENRNQIKRRNNIHLPSTTDIELLITFLNQTREKNIDILKTGFHLQSWLNLSKCTLTYLQLFNRRRSGEIERLLLLDYEKHHTIDKQSDPDIFQNLNAKSQNVAKKFVRIQIRGKLGRTVPVLVGKDWFKALQLVVEYRSQAGVSSKNPYVFGIPGGITENNHLRACDLLRNFSVECGAKNPVTLRGTLLRKHIATVVQKLNLTDTDMSLLANFMGHDEKIHRAHYRLPIVAKEIGHMSQLLTVIEEGNIDKYQGQNLDQICSENINDIEGERSRSNTSFFVKNVSRNLFPESKNMEPEVLENGTNTSNKTLSVNNNLPDTKIRRKPWNTPERLTARRACKMYLQEGAPLPSYEECAAIISKHVELKGRSMDQLRLWIHNQRKKAQRITYSRQPWRTPEKSAIRRIFSEHIRRGKLPSVFECENSRNICPILKHKSVSVIKAWVAAEINRNKQ